MSYWKDDLEKIKDKMFGKSINDRMLKSFDKKIKIKNYGKLHK